MENKVKLSMCSALLVGILVVTADLTEASSNSLNTEVAQQLVSQFKDVNKSNYAYDAINWAKSEGIIDGYSDGTYKPSEAITEAQFAKMLSHFLGLKDNKGHLIKSTSVHWSDTHYDALASYSVPLNGYFDNALRDKPVKRGVVAQSIGYLTGYANGLTNSINFMLDEEITTGQNPQFEGQDLIKFFGSQNNLTRAQVAAFLYRMHNVNIDEATALANLTHDNQEGLSLVGLANKGMSKLDNSLRVGKLGSETSINGGGNINITFTPGQVGLDVDEVRKQREEHTIGTSGGGSGLKFGEWKKDITPTNKKLVENLEKSFDFKTSDSQTYITKKENTMDSILIYNAQKDKYGNKSEKTYYDSMLWVNADYYFKSDENATKVHKLVNDAGFEISKKELAKGFLEAEKNKGFEFHILRNYRFIGAALDGFVQINKINK